MEQKVLNEEQMRAYIENEVRNALLSEGIDESLNEGFIMDLLSKFLSGSRGMNVIGNFIKEHMNIPDLINLAIGVFGVAPIVRWLCGTLGVNIDGPIGKLLVAGLSGYGAMKIGDMIQGQGGNDVSPAPAAPSGPSAGMGGPTSSTGGDGYNGGSNNGGGR